MSSTAVAAAKTTTSRSDSRPEIQALRAVAVLSVIAYHLWPGHVPGGYVGVDVFFAISGFLITGHLIRDVSRSGSVALLAFWARRARRLLPASLLVLALTAIAVYLVIPKVHWGQDFKEISASALYAQNWVLAGDAVDYLNSQNAPSPVQHYWSLSVEEQFYLAWPLLLVGAIAVTRRIRRGNPVVAFGAVLGILFIGSLITSVWLTSTDAAAAYFVTPTRVWEFAVGGLLALFAPVSGVGFDRIRTAVQWAGWVAIAASIFLYTDETPFPGWAALLPVLGTVAVIWAGSPRSSWAPTLFSSLRPVQYVGDVSYSLYLWHFPLLVIVPFAFGGGHRTRTISLAILLVAFVLAALSKRFVEDPIRRNRSVVAWRPGFTFSLAAACMAVVVAIAGTGDTFIKRSYAASNAETASLVGEGASCLGAAERLGPVQPCNNPALDGVLLPNPTGLGSDTGGAFACYDQKSVDSPIPKTCSYGSTRSGALKVAIAGDSHAAMLLPGILPKLDQLNWHLDVYVGNGCVWSALPAGNPCKPHDDALQKRFQTGPRYDLIIVTERQNPNLAADEPNARARQLASEWRPVLARGTKIVAVYDNPMVPQADQDCIARAESSYSAASKCSIKRSDAFAHSDPLPQAVKYAGKGASLVDMTAAYCGDTACPMVIGHVLVYRDHDHMTATFSKTLAPYLLQKITAGLER